MNLLNIYKTLSSSYYYYSYFTEKYTEVFSNLSKVTQLAIGTERILNQSLVPYSVLLTTELTVAHCP